MKRIKLIAATMLWILIFVSTACSSGENYKVDNALKIYTLDEDTNIRNAVKEYNKENKNLIEEKVFYNDQKSELAETLQYELATGGAPDIIIFEPDMLSELSKYMEKGVFFNIDESIKQDSKFNIEDYNSAVMEYGVFNGKRYAVPLFYSVKVLFSTDEALRKSSVSNNMSFLKIDDVSSAATEYMEQGKGKYFFSPLDFSYFMDSCGEFVNIAEKKASFHTVEFEKLLASYKKLYDASDKDITYEEYTNGLVSDMPKSGDMVFNLQGINCYKLLWAGYNSFSEDVSPEIRSISQGTEVHTSAVPVKLAAINANCKNKKAAYDFIKQLLSEKYQENSMVYYLPVNNKAYETQKAIFVKGTGGSDYITPLRGGGIKSDNSAKKAVSDVEKLMVKLDKCSLSDYKVYDIVNEVVDKFLKGSMSNTDAAKEAQHKVQEYLDVEMSTPQKKAETGTTDIEEKPKSKIRLFYLQGVDSHIANALRVFGKEYPEIEVEKDIYGTGNFDTDSDTYRIKLLTELMAGVGPDVVTFFNETYFQSLNKIVEAGVFCDLNEIISEDKSFNISDYNEKVLEAGVYEGKRYYIPLSYDFSALYSTKKTLESSNVQYDYENWTWDNFVSLSKSFKNTGTSSEKYFWGYAPYFGRLYENCEISFIDYNTKKAEFNSEEFLKLLKIYKELYPKITPEKIGDAEKNSKNYFKSSVFASGLIGLYNWEYISYSCKNVEKYTGEEPNPYPMPSLAKGKAKGYMFPVESAAVSASSSNRKGAFNFIKVLLSEDIQGVHDSFGNKNWNYMPVNKKAYEKDMKYYSSEYSDPISPELASKFDSLLKNAELGISYDKNIRQIIDEEADAYVQGKKSAKAAAAEIDRKVTLILNE